MKRKLKMILCVLMVLTIGYNVYSRFKINIIGLSDLALANVEALALSELDMEKGWSCYDWVFDNVMSETFFIINRCSDCYTVSATNFSGQDYCWH